MTKNVMKQGQGARSLSVPKADPAMIDALNQVLGNEYALAFQAQLCKWNVTGPISFTLASKFGKQCDKAAKAANDIGNRIKLLDPNAPVNFGQFQPLQEVTQKNSVPSSWAEMVSTLIQANQNAIEPCRDAIQTAQQANDVGSVFLLMKCIEKHEKAILKLGNLIAENSQSTAGNAA